MNMLMDMLLLIAQADPPLAIPLPGSALMGMALMGGFAAFARYPSSRGKRRRRGL